MIEFPKKYLRWFYLFGFFVFVGFGGLVIILSQDCTFAAYTHSFIAAFFVNLWWQLKWL